jgi:hypothetical protein
VIHGLDTGGCNSSHWAASDCWTRFLPQLTGRQVFNRSSRPTRPTSWCSASSPASHPRQEPRMLERRSRSQGVISCWYKVGREVESSRVCAITVRSRSPLQALPARGAVRRWGGQRRRCAPAWVVTDADERRRQQGCIRGGMGAYTERSEVGLAGTHAGGSGGRRARRGSLTKSRRGDSNPRPMVYETIALPLSYVGSFGRGMVPCGRP